MNLTMIRLCLLLIFTFGRSTDEEHLTKTVDVGEDVTLTCSRSSSKAGTLFWVRLVPGHLPEVLASAYTFDTGLVNTTPRVTARKDPGAFVLRIIKTELSDTAFYYCEEFDEIKRYMFNTTFLRVKGPEPDVTAIIQHASSGPVRPGDSVTLQCSVVSDNRSCSAGPSVYWFRAGTNKDHPLLVYASDGSNGECEAPQKCVFSHNISSSDAGTHHCAVATCGHIVFGNGVNLDIDGVYVWLYVFSAALTLSVIIIAILMYIIMKRNSYNSFSGSAPVQRNAPTDSDQQSQNVDENTLVNSVTHFVKKKPGKKQKRAANEAEESVIYSDVRVLQ